MLITKSLNSFIQHPNDILKECHTGPVEITGGEQSYILMTSEYLKRLLIDSYIAANLDKILAKLKNNGRISKKEVMEAIEVR